VLVEPARGWPGRLARSIRSAGYIEFISSIVENLLRRGILLIVRPYFRFGGFYLSGMVARRAQNFR